MYVISSSWEWLILTYFSSHVIKYQSPWRRRQYFPITHRNTHLISGAGTQRNCEECRIQYCNFITPSSLFCNFSNVSLPSFLSTQSVLHNTCQGWRYNYFSRFIKRCRINKSLYGYPHNNVQRHCTLPPSMQHFTLTPASCKCYSLPQ